MIVTVLFVWGGLVAAVVVGLEIRAALRRRAAARRRERTRGRSRD